MISKEKKTGHYERVCEEHEGDTGSPEVQVAVLTARIQELTEHLKKQSEGSSFQKRSAEDGWSETWSCWHT